MRNARLARGLLVVAAVVLSGAACKIEGRRQPYTPVGAEAEALKVAFNAEAGKVRVVALVAPT